MGACSLSIALWAAILMPLFGSWSALGVSPLELGLSPIWWATGFGSAAAPRLAALGVFGTAIAAGLLGLAWARLDRNGTMSESLRWSFHAWRRGWPILLLACVVTALLGPWGGSTLAVLLVIGLVTAFLIWLSCHHPQVLRSATGAGWWWTPDFPLARVALSIGLLAAGGLLGSASSSLTPSVVGDLVAVTLETLLGLGAVLCLISSARSESLASVARLSAAPQVLLRWLIVYALGVLVMLLLSVPFLAVHFIDTHLLAQAIHTHEAEATDLPLGLQALKQLANFKYGLLAPLVLGLPWLWLFEGRVLMRALGWIETDPNPAGSAQEKGT